MTEQKFNSRRKLTKFHNKYALFIFSRFLLFSVILLKFLKICKNPLLIINMISQNDKPLYLTVYQPTVLVESNNKEVL